VKREGRAASRGNDHNRDGRRRRLNSGDDDLQAPESACTYATVWDGFSPFRRFSTVIALLRRSEKVRSFWGLVGWRGRWP
jgi:hypothetical protein